MSNTEAIYSGIVSRVETLTSQLSIQEIENSCQGNDEIIGSLYDLEDQIKGELEEIIKFKDANTMYPSFELLYNLIENNIDLLSTQNQTPIHTLLFSIKLIRMLEGSFQNIPEDDVIPFLDFTSFNDIPHYIDSDFYLYVGENNYDNTILFLNSENDLSNLIEKDLTIPDAIIVLLLSLLESHSFEDNNKFLIVKSGSDQTTINKSIAALKLHLVCSGKSYHKVEVTQRNNLTAFKDRISFEKNYNQFDDSLMILSEYNSRDELLNKYLSIYHLVENFMCRYPLVKLQELNQGDMFSIRNFRGMYEDLDGKEINMIRNFFKEIFSPRYKLNNFLIMSHNKFKELVSNSIMSESDIDNTLLKLGMVNKGVALTYEKINTYTANQATAELPQKLADMVYGIRNAIVHNKETEFHLSHEYMEPCIYQFINSYILEILESVLLDLMTEDNNIIWYSHSRIKLYEE